MEVLLAIFIGVFGEALAMVLVPFGLLLSPFLLLIKVLSNHHDEVDKQKKTEAANKASAMQDFITVLNKRKENLNH